MIKIYANLVINGLKTLEEIPEKYRLAVETLINELMQK